MGRAAHIRWTLNMPKFECEDEVLQGLIDAIGSLPNAHASLHGSELSTCSSLLNRHPPP
jgi:hypothetical protein